MLQEQHDGLPERPEIEEARAVIAALDPHMTNAAPVALSTAIRAAKSLSHWFDNATTQLTWPPTVAGFSAAARPLFKMDASPEDRWVLGLLDALRPDLVFVAHRDFKASGEPSWINGAPSLSAEASSAKAPSSPRTHAASAIVVEWLNDLRQRDDSLALLREDLDGKIKRSIVSTKGTQSRARNYWLEDILIPALTDLTVEDLSDLLRFWPTHQKGTFNDPAKAMESRNFWSNLRGMEAPARRFLLSNVLPAIVDTSEWTATQRIEMLEPMIERIKSYPDLVRQRLDLWKAWGGNLDEDVSLPAEEGALSAPTTSARAWLSERGLDPDRLENAETNQKRRQRYPR